MASVRSHDTPARHGGPASDGRMPRRLALPTFRMYVHVDVLIILINIRRTSVPFIPGTTYVAMLLFNVIFVSVTAICRDFHLKSVFPLNVMIVAMLRIALKKVFNLSGHFHNNPRSLALAKKQHQGILRINSYSVQIKRRN